MAQAFASVLRDNNLIVTNANQAPPAAPAPSKFKAMLEAVASNPDSDPGTVNSLKQLFEAFSEDNKAEMTKAQQSEVLKAMVFQRDKQAVSFVESALDDLIGSDPVTTEYREILKQKVLHELNTGKDYAAARTKYENFDLDTKAIKLCAKTEVEKFNKARGITPQSKPAAGMKTNDMGDQRVLASGANNSDNGTDGLSQKQRDYYNARLGTAQRVGLDRNSEAAKEYARRGAERIKG